MLNLDILNPKQRRYTVPHHVNDIKLTYCHAGLQIDATQLTKRPLKHKSSPRLCTLCHQAVLSSPAVNDILLWLS